MNEVLIKFKENSGLDKMTLEATDNIKIREKMFALEDINMTDIHYVPISEISYLRIRDTSKNKNNGEQS
jgi:hypothetical protein